MRIYVSHAGSFDYQHKLYQPLAESALSKEHEFVFPHEHAQHGEYSKELIASSGLLLAEVSVASTGTGIEMGWAHAAGVPIVAVNEEGTKPPAAIQHVTNAIHSYANSKELLRIVEDQLKVL